ncbi:MAG: RNA pseudouridine synthase [Planctomycetaceae bacterium]|nr:RNA pseudouridine synthase [Planctomycetaceae bacterium]|tara:strand:+ start:1332 stop:2057 length:726 start_codon:yes stop_codon:yes gene_type:complete
MEDLLGDVRILYQQGPCLMINKPGGLLTQAPPHIDSVEMRLKKFIRIRDEKPGRVYLAVPHRLDRPVTGVMVFALHQRAAKRISNQFEQRLVEKEYWACVEGEVDGDQGTFIDFMRKVPGEARSEICDKSAEQAKQAILHYRVLKRKADKTWLAIELETGRTHQIRLQCGSRGYPIIGDSLYGSMLKFGEHHEDERRRCIALHSRRLKIRHPMIDEYVDMQAPLPATWTAAGIMLHKGLDQ